MDTFSIENQNRIRLLAQGVRKDHDAMDWSVSPLDLIERQGLKNVEYNLSSPSFIKKVTREISNVVKKIKAAIFIKEKLVFTDTELHSAKKPFAQAHELGHDTIPEHREILYVCSEHDLVPSVRDAMEFEANVFASEILLPIPLMDSIHKKFPLSMETVLYLSDISHGSIHTCAIKYVKTSSEICCLLILEKSEDENGNPGLFLGKNKQIPSTAWWKKYQILLAENQFFPAEHNLSKVVYSGSSDDIEKRILTVGDKDFNVHSFYNRYIVFALLFECA